MPRQWEFDQSQISARYGEPSGACQGLSAAWLKWTREADEGATVDKRARLIDASADTRQLVSAVYAATRNARLAHQQVEDTAEKRARRRFHFNEAVLAAEFSSPTERLTQAIPFAPTEAKTLEENLRTLCGFPNAGQVSTLVRDQSVISAVSTLGLFSFPTSGRLYRFITWKTAGTGAHAAHAVAARYTPTSMLFFDPNQGEEDFGTVDITGFALALGRGLPEGFSPLNDKLGLIYTVDFTT